MSRVSRCRAGIRWGLIGATLLSLAGANPQSASAQGTNLALGMSVTRSSDCSCGRATSAVDGNVDTYWQPLSADRTDDLNVWLRVDLGAPASIERAVLKFRGGTADILEFRIRTSNDELSWQTVYLRESDTGAIDGLEVAEFPAVVGRYLPNWRRPATRRAPPPAEARRSRSYPARHDRSRAVRSVTPAL